MMRVTSASPPGSRATPRMMRTARSRSTSDGAQALVAWGLIFHAMPAAGLGLLDVARSLAAVDLPMRVIELLTGGS
jgi:hypothetical protein